MKRLKHCRALTFFLGRWRMGTFEEMGAFLSARAKPAPRQGRGRAKRETSGSEAGAEGVGTFDFWLVVGMMSMHTDQFCRAWSDFFCRSSERAFLRTALQRSVCNEGSPFILSGMHPFNRNFKYKGAKPLWAMTPGELFFYFALIALILILDYLKTGMV
jgi:hypothetical protein